MTAPPPSGPVEATLVAVATRGLPGHPEHPPTTLDGGAADELLDRARAERVVGLLDEAAADGSVLVGPAAARRIGEVAVEVAAGTLLVERHTIDTHRLLAAAGVEHRVLKGVAAAHRFGGHPGLRSFADVDLLVRGEALRDAVAALEDAGHRRTQEEWSAAFTARFGKSVTLRSPEGIEVDVHRTFAAGPFGVAGDIAAVWARPAAVVRVGGADLPTLDPSTAFVHACVHAVTGQRATLAGWRDVARILPAADAGAVAEVERALRVEACVTTAVQRAVERLSLGPDAARDHLRSRAVGRLDGAWLARYGPGEHRFRRLTLIGVSAVPTVRGKLAYAWAVARR
jgi:hypothetical protein